MKALGEYLTAEDDELRSKGAFQFLERCYTISPECQGVAYLSAVLEKCPPEKLNRQAGELLGDVILDKLMPISCQKLGS